MGLLFLGALHRLDALRSTDIRVETLGEALYTKLYGGHGPRMTHWFSWRFPGLLHTAAKGGHAVSFDEKCQPDRVRRRGLQLSPLPIAAVQPLTNCSTSERSCSVVSSACR